jgi:hypothetical protein
MREDLTTEDYLNGSKTNKIINVFSDKKPYTLVL